MAKRRAAKRVTRYVRSARRRTSKTTLPITLLASLAPLGIHAYEGYKNTGEWGGFKGLLHNIALDTTGYYAAEKRFDLSYPMTRLYGPMFLGMVAHKLAGWTGINRALSRARVPLLRF